MFKKFIQFFIGNGVVFILGVLTTPFITRIISPIEMGKYSFFNTISSFMGLIIMLGLDQSFGRYFYEEKEENRGSLLISCVKLSLIAACIMSIFILVGYKPISKYMVETESFIICILLLIQVFANSISRFSLLEIRMKQKAKLYSFLNIEAKVVYLIFIGLFYIIFNDNYLVLALAFLISTIVNVIHSIYLERKVWFDKNDKKISVSKKELVRYGSPFIFSMAITWIFQSTDRVVLKQFSGYAEIGLYSGAMNIVSLLNLCQGAFTTFWTPIAYEKYCENSNNKDLFVEVNKVVSFIMLLISIILIASKDLVVLFLGKEYREAIFIFPYLVFMPIMYTISETTVLGINFKNKTKSHIYIAVVSAIFNILGNLLLVPRYGSKGAAISTGLAYVVFFVMRTYYSNKYYKVNFKLRRFAVSTISIYCLATYSSFNKFDLTTLILTIISFFIVIFLYKDTAKKVVNILKVKLRYYI